MNWKFKNLDDPPVEITVTLPPPDPATARKTGARRAWEDLIDVAEDHIAQCNTIDKHGSDERPGPWTDGYLGVYAPILRMAQRALDELGEA